ncbi:DinB family protein [Tunturiibacter lichenicola]|uniref:DinB family protein n=1 Tax=Tunturiibacter lichenicola TaxID=2051959 RepID=UPI0021B3D86E|nr:DinB family protein [Edaphobacter lichenicola]
MVKYAQESDLADLNPDELSERLATVLRDAMPWLVTISEAEASVPEGAGKWSGKQVMGHLTDSAVNNLARIVRMQIEAEPRLSGYEQMEWVRLQHYAEREWAEVLALWFALNEHVVWTIGHIDRARLGNVGVVEGDAVTLGFLIEDYVAHIQHHLRAMQRWMGTVGGRDG